MLFPVAGSDAGLRLDADREPDRLPVLRSTIDGPGTPLLVEHSRFTLTRPGLQGHRLDGSGWSTLFRPTSITDSEAEIRIEAEDRSAGLTLLTELAALPGGVLRARHTLTNIAESEYLLDSLEVSFAVPDDHTELLDFTGRHDRERAPQRRPITDGLWVRESRGGRPGADSATLMVAGQAAFDFATGRATGISVGFSGNTTLACQRSAATPTTLSGGELLLPGEIVLAPAEAYTTPWVYLVSGIGLDELAHRLHVWQRSLPSHPACQPVTLNVWEAVYFDHDLQKLLDLADVAAAVGVERYVLDDGWFHLRRSDNAGLGDWWVDETVWPQGLDPLADRVRSLGMEFGLWFEPEMVSPDSDLFRSHPEWVLQTGGRLPGMHRNQHVLNLTIPEAWTLIRDRMAAVLERYPVAFVKWDHNRDLLEAGSTARNGRAAVHEQTKAFYGLLDDLRARFPAVAWESCAAGGSRIDLGVVEKVQRFWPSDMTDALARQQIQRWTSQLVAPEYLGAHISAPTSHQTNRSISLDFRAVTALFYSFGIEWDLTSAASEDLDRLTFWCEYYKRHRAMMHSGRMVRIDTADPVVIGHSVVSTDGASALLAVTCLDEATSNRGVTIRLVGLDPHLLYRVVRRTPENAVDVTTCSGEELMCAGLWIARQRPQSALLFEIGS